VAARVVARSRQGTNLGSDQQRASGGLLVVRVSEDVQRHDGPAPMVWARVRFGVGQGKGQSCHPRQQKTVGG